MQIRTGTALDVHNFANREDTAENLMLGCVEFSDFPKLDGHSDSDAVAHALSDAILLAADLPDLGQTIGVDDDEWKSASGEKILKFILKKIRTEGWTLSNATVQIVAKHPNISSKNSQMRQKLSEICQATVSVGATTTDGAIPDLGDGKSIMALANVLLVENE